jgi:hypothetical protein
VRASWLRNPSSISITTRCLPCGRRLRAQALDLLLQLRGGAALGGWSLLADQGLDAHAKGACEEGQVRDRHAASSDFPGSHRLLRHIHSLSELHLGHGLVFAQSGDASAELLEE